MYQSKLIDGIKLAIKDGRQQLLRPSRGIAQSDVYLVEVEDTSGSEPASESRKVIIKDFNRRHTLAKWLFCRSIVNREIKVLEALADTGQVPLVYAQLDRFSFALEFIDGVSPGQSNRGRWPESYPQTANFLAEMHARGYAHNDFRRDNIMILKDGSVRFFDFASALRKPQKNTFLLCPLTALVNFMQSTDRAGLLKIKPDLTGQPLTEAEQKLRKKPLLVRILRDFWKHYINNPILHRLK